MHAIADTHALIWYLLNDPRLSPAVRAVFTGAAAQSHFAWIDAPLWRQRNGANQR